MKFIRHLLFSAIVTGSASACTNPDHHDASHAHTSTPSSPVSAQPEHGSHDPAHGGIVMMDPKHHVEIVLDPESGQHRVYVSDDLRAALPASTFDEVTLTVAGETLAMRRTPDDTAWQATGTRVRATGAEVSIAYSKGGQQVARFDDLPIEYVLTGKMPDAAPQATQEPVIPHGKPGHQH